MRSTRRGETLVIMAFDSRWEREHSTLQSQVQLLDGLDVGARGRMPRSSRPRGERGIGIWLASRLRAWSSRVRVLLA